MVFGARKEVAAHQPPRSRCVVGPLSVALAPLLLLPIAWLCLVHVLLPLWNDGRWGWWLLTGQLTATALFAALPSFQDIRLGARSLLLYVVTGALVLQVYARTQPDMGALCAKWTGCSGSDNGLRQQSAQLQTISPAV